MQYKRPVRTWFIKQDVALALVTVLQKVKVRRERSHLLLAGR